MDVKLLISGIIGLVCLIISITYGIVIFFKCRISHKMISIVNMILFLLFPVLEYIIVLYICLSGSECTYVQFVLLTVSILMGLVGNYALVDYLFMSSQRKELEKKHLDPVNESALSGQMLEFEKNRNMVAIISQNEFLTKIDDIISKADDVETYESINQVCENSFVNAVMVQKSQECEKEGIVLTSHIDIPNNIRVDSLALSSIFINLLDNAINACKVFAGDDKYINIRSLIQGDMILINIINSADRNSQKQDNSRKHYGKKIIEAYVKNYDGYYKSKLDLKNKCYEVNVMLQEDNNGIID